MLISSFYSHFFYFNPSQVVILFPALWICFFFIPIHQLLLKGLNNIFNYIQGWLKLKNHCIFSIVKWMVNQFSWQPTATITTLIYINLDAHKDLIGFSLLDLCIFPYFCNLFMKEKMNSLHINPFYYVKLYRSCLLLLLIHFKWAIRISLLYTWDML